MEKHKMGKNAEESSPTMDSKENMLEELDSLYNKFEHRIENRSSFNRTVQVTRPNQEEIEGLNRLKLSRTRLKIMYQRLQATDDQSCMTLREEARKLVEEAKILLGSPKP